MSEKISVKSVELEGKALEWAVEMAGCPCFRELVCGEFIFFAPNPWPGAVKVFAHYQGGRKVGGRDHAEAAYRLKVLSVFGEFVDVPAKYVEVAA